MKNCKIWSSREYSKIYKEIETKKVWTPEWKGDDDDDKKGHEKTEWELILEIGAITDNVQGKERDSSGRKET